MKALIISDVHANIDALRAVFAAEPDADVTYCAGDLVDYGLNPKEVLDFVREHNIHTVSGNHDRRLLRLEDAGEKVDLTEQYSFVTYCRSLLSAEDVAYLRTLPVELCWEMDGIEYFMTHHYDPDYSNLLLSRTDFAKYWVEKYPNSDPNKEHRMIFGHTHKAGAMRLDDKMLWMNPGSVSYRRPDDPTKNADYAVIEDGEIHLRYVPYEKKHLYDKVLSMNLYEGEKEVGLFFFGEEPEENTL